MLPLLWIALFFLTFFTSAKARRTAVLTDAARRAAAVCAGSRRRGAGTSLLALGTSGSILLLRLVFSLVCVGQPAAAGSRRADPAAGLCGRQRLGAGAAEAVVGLRLDAAFRSLRGRSASAGFKPLERALFHRGAFGIGGAGSGLYLPAEVLWASVRCCLQGPPASCCWQSRAGIRCECFFGGGQFVEG